MNVAISSVQFSSVQSLSHVRLFATPWIAACQASCPSPTPGVHSDSRPSSWWCHPAISSSVISFSSCPQSLPTSESFPMSQLFAWGGQSTGVSALASFLPKMFYFTFPQTLRWKSANPQNADSQTLSLWIVCIYTHTPLFHKSMTIPNGAIFCNFLQITTCLSTALSKMMKSINISQSCWVSSWSPKA